MGNPQTPQDAVALLDALEKAGSFRALAKELGRTHSTVQTWVNKARRIVTKNYKPKKRQIKREERLRELVEYMGGRCQLCKKEYPPPAFDFHHKNPDEKEHGISRIILHDFETVKAEADKCALLCANCHRIAHYVDSNLFIKKPGLE